MDQLNLKNIYYDPKTGYTGLVKFYKRVKELDNSITMSDVKAFLNRQYTFQINREGVRPKYYRTILANKPRDNYQMDIMVYDRYADGPYNHILCCVDVNSRYADCEPLKSRKVGEEEDVEGVLPAIKKIFKRMGLPKNINTDNEFLVSNAIQRYFRDNNITHHVSEPFEINKQAIVERFNRTLAGLIQRYRTGSNKNNWTEELENLLDNYNSSYHRTIKARPINVFSGIEVSHQTPIYTFETPLKVGDNVRLKLTKSTFGKGDALKYSPEIYTIVEQKDGVSNGIKLKKFKLKDIKTNQILTKPRMYWKDYEVKLVDSIVETKEGQEVIPQAQPQTPLETKEKVSEVKKSSSQTHQALSDRRKDLELLGKDALRKLASSLGLGKQISFYKIINGKKSKAYHPKDFVIDAILKHENKKN